MPASAIASSLELLHFTTWPLTPASAQVRLAFFSRLLMAAWLLELIAIRFPCLASCAITWPVTVDLPVPGGPCKARVMPLLLARKSRQQFAHSVGIALEFAVERLECGQRLAFQQLLDRSRELLVAIDPCLRLVLPGCLAGAC